MQGEIDQDMHALMSWILQLRDVHTTQHEATLVAVLAHILRIYLAMFQHSGRMQPEPSRDLHTRCKQVGLCAILREFKRQPSWSVDGLSKRANRCDKSAATANGAPSGLAASAEDQTQLLRSLCRSVDKCVRCTC